MSCSSLEGGEDTFEKHLFRVELSSTHRHEMSEKRIKNRSLGFRDVVDFDK